MLSSNQNAAGGLHTEQSANGLGTIYDTLKYEKSIDILAMLLLGFGFLMVFVRKHGFGSILAEFAAASWYMKSPGPI